MGTYGRSFVRTKKFAFSQQIENFPWQLRRGAYISPKYYCESAECNWSIIIEPKREWFLRVLPSDYIEISLKRQDYSKACQSVDVSLAIVDSSGIGSNITVSKEVHFTPSSDEETVLRIHKNDLFHGYFIGLNKARFISRDILTVKCEITVYETVEENYENEEKFEDTAKKAKKGVFKCLLSHLGFMVVLFLLIWADAYNFSVACFSIIGANAVVAVVILLLVNGKKLWKLVKSYDDIIYSKPRKTADNKVKTN